MNEKFVLKKINELENSIETKILSIQDDEFSVDNKVLNEYLIVYETFLNVIRVMVSETKELKNEKIDEQEITDWLDKIEMFIKSAEKFVLVRNDIETIIEDIRSDIMKTSLNSIVKEIAEYKMLVDIVSRCKGNAKLKFRLNKTYSNMLYVINETLEARIHGYLECINNLSDEIGKSMDDILKNMEYVFELFRSNEDSGVESGIENIKTATFSTLMNIAKSYGYGVKRYNGSHAVVEDSRGNCTVIPFKSNNKTIGKGLTHKILKDISCNV